MNKNYKFSPFEIAFSGVSGSGKTTLIEKLMKKLAKTYRVAFIKNDIHGFQMDKKGKDTYRIYHAGAESAYISSPTERAYLSKLPLSYSIFKQELFLYDFVLIEGYKDEAISKYLITTYEKAKEIDFSHKKYRNLLGIILDEDKQIEGIPTFYRNDTQGIYKDLVKHLNKKEPKLDALILVGGKSSRMGQDKGKMVYNQKPQVDFLHELLSPFVSNIYVSINSTQKDIPEYSKYQTIKDRIIEIGPIGGISSAFMKHHDRALLVVACDLPLINKEMLFDLINQRDFLKAGTFFSSRFIFEPLFGIYEPKCLPFFMSSIAEGDYSMRSALKDLRVKIIDNNFTNNFKNVNTKEEFDDFFLS